VINPESQHPVEISTDIHINQYNCCNGNGAECCEVEGPVDALSAVCVSGQQMTAHGGERGPDATVHFRTVPRYKARGLWTFDTRISLT
jgi:hypothetical protein